jgi:hypothetical protein
MLLRFRVSWIQVMALKKYKLVLDLQIIVNFYVMIIRFCLIILLYIKQQGRLIRVQASEAQFSLSTLRYCWLTNNNLSRRLERWNPLRLNSGEYLLYCLSTNNLMTLHDLVFSFFSWITSNCLALVHVHPRRWRNIAFRHWSTLGWI